MSMSVCECGRGRGGVGVEERVIDGSCSQFEWSTHSFAQLFFNTLLRIWFSLTAVRERAQSQRVQLYVPFPSRSHMTSKFNNQFPIAACTFVIIILLNVAETAPITTCLCIYSIYL
jgi:hypothetical protein